MHHFTLAGRTRPRGDSLSLLALGLALLAAAPAEAKSAAPSAEPPRPAVQPSLPARPVADPATESIEADINGDAITTGFNPQFLLDGLTAITTNEVALSFTQSTKPVVLSGVQADESAASDDFRYLLMPRRLLS